MDWNGICRYSSDYCRLRLLRGDYYTCEASVETTVIPITSTVPNPLVLSTLTTTDTYSGDVTAVNPVVAPTDGIEVSKYTFMDYYVNVVYTAPSSCSYTTSQTLTTAVAIYVPNDAKKIVKAEMITTSTHTFDSINGEYTKTMAFLDPSDVPTGIYSSASSKNKPAIYTSCSYFNYRVNGTDILQSDGGDEEDYYGCDEFTWYIGGSAFPGGYCCSDGCHYTWGIAPWGLALAGFFGWFGLFLIIGLVESWFIFRRAMFSQKVRRGLPYGFACLCPILSCLTLFTVKKYPAKATG